MCLKIRLLLSRAVSGIQSDLRCDALLKYILVLTFTLAGFAFWYSAPNFTRPDEFSRLVDGMVVINHVIANPSIDALQRGITHGRMFGASIYLSALALVPAYLIAVVTGQLDLIVSANTFRSRWEVWTALPEWFWTTSLITGRLLVVLFSVGCVYLTYRIGMTMRNRTAGRLAGLLLALSFSFLRSSHEFAEDVPALFFLLLGFYCALRYTETGDDTVFLAGCAASGLAVAFKLTTGVVVVVLGMAYLLRARHVRNTGDTVRKALVRPSMLVCGLLLGVGAIAVGFPSVLVAGPDPFVDRLLHSTTEKATVERHGSTPILRQFVHYYAGGLGIPLAIACGGGVLASFPRLRKNGIETSGVALTLTALVVCLLVFSRWEYVQPHHLVPTFPFLAVLAGVALSRFNARSRLARPIIALLVVTTGLYASVGVLGYAAGEGDAPEQWITTRVPENATMEVYVPRPQLAAPVHGRPVGHYISPKADTYNRLKGKTWNAAGFDEWRHNLAERDPDYIQFPRFGWKFVPDSAKERYTVVATFELDWPLRDVVRSLGGEYGYPEFLPARRIVILERTDRCGRSPTCQNATKRQS